MIRAETCHHCDNLVLLEDKPVGEIVECTSCNIKYLIWEQWVFGEGYTTFLEETGNGNCKQIKQGKAT